MNDAGRDDLDVMLEVKDKNLSAIKCSLCAAKNRNVPALEREWARYKYAVMEHSQTAYQEIRRLFHGGNADPIAFYALVERALSRPAEPGGAVNAAQHVWGYFKACASETEKRSFQTALDRFQEGRLTLDAVKRKLYALAEKYESAYLKESYYFWL